MAEYKTVHMRYDKYLEMKAKAEAEIVHCKDCKHFYRYGELWGVCEYTRKYQEKALDVNPEHFCGWGEKK